MTSLQMSDADFDRLENTLGDAVICDRCGATFDTYGFDTCTAPLDEPCPGFEAVEAALGNRSFRKRYGLPPQKGSNS